MAIATQTEGYSAEDLQDLVARAMHQMAMRVVRDEEEVRCFAYTVLRVDIIRLRKAATIVLTPGDFTAAQVDFVPLSLRDVKLQKSDVAWFDIGGAWGVLEWANPAN
jgi:peroxin-1